jgi:hypothetical protein
MRLLRGSMALMAFAACAAPAIAGCAATAPSHGATQAPSHHRAPSLLDRRLKVPLPPPVGSRVLCHELTAVRGLTVDRANLEPKNHFRFAFPAQVTVTRSSDAQAVARALCALPVQTLVNCPADWGIRYLLTFSPARLHLATVEIAATGCGSVTGLGLPRHEVTLRFWHTLSSAMHLAKTPAGGVVILKGSMPGIFY